MGDKMTEILFYAVFLFVVGFGFLTQNMLMASIGVSLLIIFTLVHS